MSLLDTFLNEVGNKKCANCDIQDAMPFKIRMNPWTESDAQKIEAEINKYLRHQEYSRSASEVASGKASFLAFDGDGVLVDDRGTNRESQKKFAKEHIEVEYSEKYGTLVSNPEAWGAVEFPMARPPYQNLLFWLQDDEFQGWIWLITHTEDKESIYYKYSLVSAGTKELSVDEYDLELLKRDVERKTGLPYVYNTDMGRIDFYQRKDTGEINFGDLFIKTFEGKPCTYYSEVKIVYALGIYKAMKFCSIINCSNITIDKVKPCSDQVNRKRRQKGKKELITFYTLKIKPKTSYKNDNTESKNLWSNRIHLVRGHFKHYTEDAPLFGKHTGLYWWQPHVRGE